VLCFSVRRRATPKTPKRSSKEEVSRFRLQAMVADLEGYDYETLVKPTEEMVAIFVLSSYGG
jgi:NADPH-ferrihemoprotein reductase